MKRMSRRRERREEQKGNNVILLPPIAIARCGGAKGWVMWSSPAFMEREWSEGVGSVGATVSG